MLRKHSLSSVLFLSFVGTMAACSTNVSQKGQLITCQTDPGTGVILRCEPGGGDGGANTCTDVDEDGDGDCHDDQSTTPTTKRAPDDGDSDGDGVPDSEDCDEHPGEDDDDDSGGADLPYDIKMSLGETYTPIADAFAEKGGQPASIVSVTGATWRAAELSAGTPFTIDQTDCDHDGNRDVGRDRVIVTWTNADGSTESDHLDLRYCE